MSLPNRLIDPEHQERFLKLIRAGVPIGTAVRAIPVGKTTFYAVLKEGREKPKGRWGQFVRDFEQAEAEAEIRLTTQWQAQCPDDWRAAMSYLSRRWPERWAEKQVVRVEAEKQVNGLLDKLESALPPETYLTVLQALERVTDEEGEAEA